MSYKILAINPDLCTGCRVCELVCSLVKENECNPRKSRIRVIKIDREGFDLPLFCQHCGEPLCREVCPVKALSRDPQTGAIILNPDLCIGCRSCTLACPFGHISFDSEAGICRKCDLCGGDPQCVRFCETKALFYERPEIIETQRQSKVIDGIFGELGKTFLGAH